MELHVLNTFLHFTPGRTCLRRSASDSCVAAARRTDIPHCFAPEDCSCPRSCSRHNSADSDNSTCEASTLCESDSEVSTFGVNISRRCSENDVEGWANRVRTVAVSISAESDVKILTPMNVANGPDQGMLSLLQDDIKRLQRENATLKAMVTQEVPARERRATRRSSRRADNRTSVMVKNIPNCFTRGMFLEFLDDIGFLEKCDFLHLPVDARTRVNRGYAFLNFVEPAVVAHFWRKIDGCDWSSGRFAIPSHKVCRVSWCIHQGQRACVDKSFKSSSA